MASYFNDSPIETEDDDLYGIHAFARSLAKSIENLERPVGTAIALNGPWGSGKSSAVNLVRRELEKSDDPSLVISEFKCWWYRGEEALALAYLQNLHALLRDSFADKVKDVVPKLGRSLLQAGPVLGSAISLSTASPIGDMAAKSIDFFDKLFPAEETLEKTFRELAKILHDENRRFLIIVDDIDRLTPDEALAIFRLIKSVGRLPNIMYLLVFDRSLADKAVAERYPSEGPHFLEKIIQASFELPSPLRTDLNIVILNAINDTCGGIDEPTRQRLLNIFHDVVAPYLTTPRHVMRFRSAISVTWPAIEGEVNVADFVALETIRLYEPSLYQLLRSNRSSLCHIPDHRDKRNDDRFDSYLTQIDETNHHTVKLALQRLFPRFEEIVYSSSSYSRWDAERRVCVDSHFDTYFRLSLSPESLAMTHIDELTSHAADEDFIQSTLRNAAKEMRSIGTSMVPVYLDELNTHGPKISRNHVAPFLSALFEIHDEINLECDQDRGPMGLGDTTLRYHWLIRRLTDQRFNIDERTDLYLSSLEQASLGWLVHFVASARDCYSDRDGGRLTEDQCLVREDALDELTTRALTKIRSAAKDGSLIGHDDLVYILYRWRDFLGNDPSEVRAWTDSILTEEKSLVILSEKFTGESWSQNIGLVGLGDRTSQRHIRVQIDENTDIVDVPTLISNLRRLLTDDNLPDNSRKTVDKFLTALNQQGDE